MSKPLILSLLVFVFSFAASPVAASDGRCDPAHEVCIADPDNGFGAPIENLDQSLPQLCAAREVFCNYVWSIPTVELEPFGDLDAEQTKNAVLIWNVFQRHPVTTPAAALTVAWCESLFRSGAENGQSSATGLFQYLRATWVNETAQAPQLALSGDLSERHDPLASASLTADVVARNGSWQLWECRSQLGGDWSAPAFWPAAVR